MERQSSRKGNMERQSSRRSSTSPSNYEKMETHKRSSSEDIREAGAGRQPVFGSARYGSHRLDGMGAPGGNMDGNNSYSAEQIMGRFGSRRNVDGNNSHSAEQIMGRFGSKRQSSRRSSTSRHSNLSDVILRELAISENAFQPNDLLKEGLDEWRDRSLNLQLMKRTQSMKLARKQRYPGKFQDNIPEKSDVNFEDDSQPLFPAYESRARHRYDVDFKKDDIRRNEDGSPLEISDEYGTALSCAPKDALVHVAMLYHQALLQHGFKEEAEKIAHYLAVIETAEIDELAAEVTGIDALLKDGLLKYLTSIAPLLPTIPRQVVKFKNVGFTGTIQLDAGYESVGTKVKELLKGPFKKSNLEKHTLLKDLTGYLMPGSLTLLMGTPGSGMHVTCSVLSGRSKDIEGASTHGTVTYNGRSVHDIKAKRFISVVGPNDDHFAYLTVRETVEFARDCSQYYKTKHYPEELKVIMADALKLGQDPKLETNLSVMGLKRIADRRVGNALMPFTTEAERHRLSVAENMAGTYAVYLFDQLNKGLDHIVTFDLITSLRIFARIRSSTLLASLTQPTQDVFDLFDRLIVLDRGEVVYQGPRQDALPYFESLGYVKPKHLSVPEFLEEVTTTDGAMYLQPGYPRLSSEAFAAAYKKSDLYKDVCRIVDSPDVRENFWVEGSAPLGVTISDIRSDKHSENGGGKSVPVVTSISEKGGSLVDVHINQTLGIFPEDEVVGYGGPTGALRFLKHGDTNEKDFSRLDETGEPVRLQLERPLIDDGSYDQQFSRDYVQTPWQEFKILLKRDLRQTKRYKLGLIVRAFQVFFLAIYIGMVFFRVHPDSKTLNMTLLRSVFFVSLLDMTMFNLGQLPGLFEERKVFYKQNGQNFYRPLPYMLDKLVGSLPCSFIEATAWTLIVYFLTNLSVSDGGWHFWVFYLIILMTVLNGAALVRCLTFLAPDLPSANAMSGMFIIIFVTFAGFLIPRFQVRKWWIWAYYIDPIQWGVQTLIINEFTSSRYNILCRDIDVNQLYQCKGRPNDKIGHAFLAVGQFYTSQSWIGVGVSVIVAWFVLFNLLTLRAISNIRHVPKTVITPSAEAKYLRKTESLIDRDLESQKSKLSIQAVPVTLSWHELSYDILLSNVDRSLPLLSYVSGWADPGEMVAIVGGTGVGKSVLLNCLAGHGVDLERVSGQILVNGYPRKQASFARVVGYVDRIEAYSPYMTILEAIAFSTEIQLGKTTTTEQRRKFAREVLDLCQLKNISNLLVKSLGLNPTTYAEATRLRIATEVAGNPSILFMDSPTKNLDSRSALSIVKLLQKIADTGRTVITAMALHNHRILTCFTSVQILKSGGEVVYWGPIGQDGELLRGYFESIPGTPPCPPDTSAATYAVDVVGDGVQDRKALKDYAYEYRVNELSLHNHVQLQRLRRLKGSMGPEITDTDFGSTFFMRARNIIVKLQLFYWRNVTYSWGRFFSSMITATILGSIFWQQESHNLPGLNVKAGAIFISTLLQALSNSSAAIPQVLAGRAAFNRERSARQYNIFLYSTAWTLGEIPLLLISTLIYSLIFCSMTGIAFHRATSFFRYWFVIFEFTIGITFWGMLIGSVAKLPQIAGTLVTLFVGIWVATSGLVVPKRKILPQFLWIFWTNPVQYALAALTTIAFYCETDKSTCMNHGLNPLCATDATACPLCDCERLRDNNAFAWNTIKYNRSLHHSNIYYNEFYLFCFLIFFRILTFLVWFYQAKGLKVRAHLFK